MSGYNSLMESRNSIISKISLDSLMYTEKEKEKEEKEEADKIKFITVIDVEIEDETRIIWRGVNNQINIIVIVN